MMHVAGQVAAIFFFLGHGIFIIIWEFSAIGLDSWFLVCLGGKMICYLLLGGILLLKICARGMAAEQPELTSA